ncbi:Coenzyme F420 hydrogenase/dehydrogenase, beta subunit C-terminal domain [Sedimentibacter sp.]|uniref:Coenzyme F420 hydrogenase/dehydrogenase, beta subunit C-terminal domain n=1 Tax=Sedimentibacter sp. TaxID=1960295 RepID=UPI00289890B0|nr:Coenzyme F420 hydrogenase/dehydrogenase, beta subunit C-terminal domain [Sedimentibacter sp.]
MLELKKEKCTGCGACNNACPIKCINMEEDEEGFLYPQVDFQKCTECGLCEKSCPAINIPVRENFKEPEVYAAWSLDDAVRADSSSGGIFTELSHKVLDDGGYVSGARYNTDNLVEHCLINRREQLHELRQSKYVQSETGLIFKDVKMLLEENKTVMFTGTPCQSAGLLQYLDKKYDNLFLCDIVCHGVNSPMVYLKYFKELEEEYSSRIKTINFRNKRNGWKEFGTSVIFENGEEYFRSHKTDSFFKGFLANLYLRRSCYNCQFKGFPRVSDITLADFWGVVLNNEKEIFKGISLILINSEKGKFYIEKISNNISKMQKTLNDAMLKNPCMVKSVPMSTKRDLMFKALKKEINVENIICSIINY